MRNEILKFFNFFYIREENKFIIEYSTTFEQKSVNICNLKLKHRNMKLDGGKSEK